MPARKQSERTSARKSKNQVEEPEPAGGAASGAFGAQLMAVIKASVLYQVGPKMPVILRQFPAVVKQLQAGTYTATVNKVEEPKQDAPAAETAEEQEDTAATEKTGEEKAAPITGNVLDYEVKGDASSLFVLLATRLTVANPLGLFATGDECVKAFRMLKGLEFDGGPKSKKKNGVSARLMGNVQNNLLQYIHILWALMMLRSLLFRSFFACLPWLFLYQVGSVMLPLQKTAKVPLPLEKAPLEFRVVGTMFLHGLVWFFFLYEFVFRVWWLEWVFAAALIGAHTYVFRPLDA